MRGPLRTDTRLAAIAGPPLFEGVGDRITRPDPLRGITLLCVITRVESSSVYSGYHYALGSPVASQGGIQLRNNNSISQLGVRWDTANADSNKALLIEGNPTYPAAFYVRINDGMTELTAGRIGLQRSAVVAPGGGITRVASTFPNPDAVGAGLVFDRALSDDQLLRVLKYLTARYATPPRCDVAASASLWELAA